jgi:hypothetical protein
MSILKFKDKIEEVVKRFPDKPLGHAEVGKIVNEKLESSKELDVDKIKFALGVEGNTQIRVFNSPDDKDEEDGIIGIEADFESENEMKLTPVIPFDDNHAWIKYRVSAKPKVNAKATFSPVEFKVDGNIKAAFIDYHFHPNRNENTRDAIMADSRNLRLPVFANDILQLKKNEALAYRVRGELTTGLTLKWLDLFNSNLNWLSQFFKQGELLMIDISGGPEFGVEVGVVDDFFLVFSCKDENNLHIAVKKSDSSTLKARAGLNVTVKFKDQKMAENGIKEIIASLFESITGSSMDGINTLFEKEKQEDLDSRQHALLEKLLDKLKVTDNFLNFKDKWENLKEKIEKSMQEAAKLKIEAGFTYEYLRVKGKDVLLEGVLEKNVLDDRTLDNYLKDLLVLNLSPILENKMFKLKRYLRQDSLMRQRSWGFSLGIGKWGAKSKDTIKESKVIQENEIDNSKSKRFAYDGMRKYEGEWGKDKFEWLIDFKADMTKFSSGKEPLASEFDYGLHLLWKWTEKKLSDEELTEYLDHAIIWKVIDPADVGDIRSKVNKIQGKIGNNEKTTITIDFKFNNDSFRKLILKLEPHDQKLWAKALGKAVPWLSGKRAREDTDNREKIYAPIWEKYFDDPEAFAINWKDYINTELRKVPGGKEMRNYELGIFPTKPKEDPHTLIGLIWKNSEKISGDYSGTLYRWNEFAKGVEIIQKALEGKSVDNSYRAIENAFGNMVKLWNQVLHVRAVGAYLMDFAEKNPEIFSQVERTLIIEFPDKDKQIIVSTSSKE